MNRSTSLSEFIDLQAGKADEQISQALAASHTDELLKDLDELLRAANPATRALGQGIIGMVGRLAAQVTQLQQSVEQTYRSRSDRIRIDPLPFIPESRRTNPLPLAKHFEIEAAAAAFSGTGWYGLETNGISSWRWTGAAPNATILLPTLGGRRLRLTLNLWMPFGHNFDDTAIAVLVNDMRVDLEPTNPKSDHTDFKGEFELPEDEGFGTFTLVLQSELFVDASASPQRETRTLGVGLHKVTLDRLSI